jgi:hypothetical protein
MPALGHCPRVACAQYDQLKTDRQSDTIPAGAAVVAICAVILSWLHVTRLADELGGYQRARASLVAAVGAQESAAKKDDADENAIENSIASLDLSAFPTKVRKTVERLEDPKFSDLGRVQLDSDFAALFRKLRLPEDKLAVLKGLLADRLNVEREAIDLSLAEDLSIDDMPDKKEILAAGTAEIDAAIAEKLGTEVSAMVETYEASMSARKFMVQPFAEHLRFGPDALNDAQLDILSTAASQADFGVNTIIARPPVPPIPVSLDNAVVQALNPSQQTAYREYKTIWEVSRQKAILDVASYVRRQAANSNAASR